MTKFVYLRIEGWRQFGQVKIDLHPRLTVLTGANGAGKSSLIRIFTRHFGFDRQFLATPVRNSNGAFEYFTGIFSGLISRAWQLISIDSDAQSKIGTIGYDNGSSSNISVPRRSAVQFSVQIDQQQRVPGIHIDSHAPVSFFQQVGQIPTTIIDAATAFNNYNGEILNRYHGNHSGFTPAYRMKEAIIAMAMFGEGNRHVQGNREVLQAYQTFIQSLKKMLPESLGFIDLAIRPPEVVMVTKSGEFLIDAASGGVMTIIDLTWRLHMFSLQQSEFVVTIDEPENHLHPSMQRSLMRRLLDTFPKAQFIIATHSPFMVSSVRDSHVYVLRYRNTETGQLEIGERVMATETSRVVSVKLDTVNKAGSASEILRDVLGVPATIPEWVEDSLVDVINKYRSREINASTLSDLRSELARLGCDELYPDALAALTRPQ